MEATIRAEFTKFRTVRGWVIALCAAALLFVIVLATTFATSEYRRRLIRTTILGSESGNWLMRLTPTAAFAIQATLPRSNLVTSVYTPPNGYFPIGPWTGLAVLAAYAAVALGAATWFVRRRDA